MDENKGFPNWEKMYHDLSKRTQCLEGENSTLSSKVIGYENIIEKKQETIKILHEKIWKLEGKVEAYETAFIYSRR